MKIIFLGAPGAGKGTLAEIVSKKLSIPTISTGAMIREAIKAGTPIGVSAKSVIEAGGLLSDEIVIDIVRERIAKKDCEKGFILDGFPRTIGQAEALDNLGVTIDRVLKINVSDEEILERMSGRRVCPACGDTYHVENNPSKDGVHCDKCGEVLATRSDDTPEVVKSRLEIYHKETAPLEDYYREKGILLDVKGERDVSKTRHNALSALGIE